MNTITCEHCGASIDTKPKQTFSLGFPSYTCKACNQQTLYPLTTGTRVMYWAFIVIGIFGVLLASVEHRVIFPGLLVILAIVALSKDADMRKKLKIKIAKTQV